MRYGFFAAGVLAASLFAATSVRAATSAPRIGVVDLNAVIGDSQRGQDATKQLQALVQKLQGDMNDRKQKLLVIKQQIDNYKGDSKSSDYQKLQKNYEDGQNEVQQFGLTANQDIQARRQEILQPIEQELLQVVDQYGKSHHYDIILNKNSGAVFTADKYDVTKDVTAAMDQDWAKQQKSQPAAKSGGG